MANKFGKKHLATGHWSSPWRTVRAMQVPEKIRVWLQDKLITRGRWVDLYLPVSASTPGVVGCTCVKNTTDSSDRACMTCYGTKFAPGFVKFLHQTQFWCSAEHASFTLTNTQPSTAKKANVIVLGEDQTAGTVETTDKAFANENAIDWELQLVAYKRATGSTIALEFSTDGGTSWTPVTLTETTPGPGLSGIIAGSALSGTGNVRFRVTMTRVATTDLTPAFEIVRMRRVRAEDENRETIRRRPDHVTGRILILRPWVNETESLEPGRGRQIEHLSDRTWTSPLDFFDTSLTPDTYACRVDDAVGPHPFYVFASGIQQGTRYVITKMAYNDQFGIFTHQFFDDRRAQEGEAYFLAW